MIDALRQDLVHSMRRLRHSPGFALVAVATLAIGIGATSAIFSVVDAVLLRPLAYRDPGGLVALFAHETKQGGRRNPTSPADFLEWKKASVSLDRLTAAHPWSPVLTGRGHAEELPALKATPELFDLLGVPPLHGRVFHGPEDERQVVLGHSLWQRRFGGDPGIVGQSIVLDGQSHVVAGVMPPGFRFPPFWATGAEMWVPLVLRAEHAADHNQFLRVFGRLRPGASLAGAQAEMDVVGARLASAWPGSNTAVGVNVEALQEPVVSRARPPFSCWPERSALVLLIACANVTSLLLAQGLAREKEAAIRSRSRREPGAPRAAGPPRERRAGDGRRALRARPGPTGRVGARGAGDGLVSRGSRRSRWTAAWPPSRSPSPSSPGSWRGSCRRCAPRVPPSCPRSKQGERLASGRGRHRLHDVLVIGEFALAVVLLVGAGLLIQSFLRLQRPDTGFRSEGLLTVTLSLSGATRAEGERRPAFLAELEEAVRSLPGVESAAFVNHVPDRRRHLEDRLRHRGTSRPRPRRRASGGDAHGDRAVPRRDGGPAPARARPRRDATGGMRPPSSS